MEGGGGGSHGHGWREKREKYEGLKKKYHTLGSRHIQRRGCLVFFFFFCVLAVYSTEHGAIRGSAESPALSAAAIHVGGGGGGSLWAK